MAVTNLDTVVNQIQKFWSPLFMEELRATTLLPSLVNKTYKGAINEEGDTVRVSQINKGTGQNRTVGVDADVFETEELKTSYVDIKADKRAVAAFEFSDLVSLQSQIDAEANGGEASPIRKTMVDMINDQINAYLYSLIAPSTSAPDHLINGVSTFDKSQLLANRLLKSQAKWKKDGQHWILADPSYYNDLLADTNLSSKDYVDGDQPVVGGQIATERFGFKILEDETLGVDQALTFHPDFLHLVQQTSVQFEISKLHANKKFGFLISADIIYGGKIGIDGGKKHILTNNAANGVYAVSMA